MSTNSRILTTVVGSYPLPTWLAQSPTEQHLTDAMRVVLDTQAQAGIDVVCDGEFSRFDVNHPETNGMIEYFLRPMAGIRTDVTYREALEYRRDVGMSYRLKPPGVVDGPLDEGMLDLPAACARGRALTDRTYKFTLTGPHMLAKTLVDKHYGNIVDLTMALADVLAAQVADCEAEIIQVDEANLPGHPDEADWAAEAMNRVLDQVKGTAAVHLCFGNYGGQSIQKGSWAKLMGYLNALHCDHIVMECAHRPASDLEAFKDLRPEIGFGLGVVDIKRTEVETADQIAAAIEHAEKVVGPGRVRYVHPDCGFWMLQRSIADAKMRALVKGRDLFEGR